MWHKLYKSRADHLLIRPVEHLPIKLSKPPAQTRPNHPHSIIHSRMHTKPHGGGCISTLRQLRATHSGGRWKVKCGGYILVNVLVVPVLLTAPAVIHSLMHFPDFHSFNSIDFSFCLLRGCPMYNMYCTVVLRQDLCPVCCT